MRFSFGCQSDNDFLRYDWSIQKTDVAEGIRTSCRLICSGHFVMRRGRQSEIDNTFQEREQRIIYFCITNHKSNFRQTCYLHSRTPLRLYEVDWALLFRTVVALLFWSVLGYSRLRQPACFFETFDLISTYNPKKERTNFVYYKVGQIYTCVCALTVFSLLGCVRITKNPY